MVSSSQITHKLKQQPNPAAAEFKIWQKTRYLVAQIPASPDFTGTKISYYKGCMVIPGPKANPEVSDVLGVKHLTMRDFQILKSLHFIRFVDNKTTADAGNEVTQALYTVMADSDADQYEKKLREDLNNERKTVPS